MADDGTVYSTEHGRMCPACGQPTAKCRCATSKAPPAGDGIVRVNRETKGRKGKGVTIVRGLPLGAAELKQLGRELKNTCGCGGTIKDGTIEIQGDHRQRLMEILQAKGWTVKQAGG